MKMRLSARGGWLLVALGLALLLAVALSPFASSSPDGLEKVAEESGFADAAAQTPFWRSSPLPDYELSLLGESPLSTSLAGLVGTLAAFGLAWALARLLRKPKLEGDELGHEHG